MATQVGFELLVLDESLAAVRALELDAFVNLGDGHDVELLEQLWVLSNDVLVEQVSLLDVCEAWLLIEVLESLIHLWVVLTVKFVLDVGKCVSGVGEIMSK